MKIYLITRRAYSLKKIYKETERYFSNGITRMHKEIAKRDNRGSSQKKKKKKKGKPRRNIVARESREIAYVKIR